MRLSIEVKGVARENFKNLVALSFVLTISTSLNSEEVGFKWTITSFPFNWEAYSPSSGSVIRGDAANRSEMN